MPSNTTASEDRSMSAVGEVLQIIERLDGELDKAKARIKELENERDNLQERLDQALARE